MDFFIQIYYAFFVADYSYNVRKMSVCFLLPEQLYFYTSKQNTRYGW